MFTAKNQINRFEVKYEWGECYLVGFLSPRGDGVILLVMNKITGCVVMNKNDTRYLNVQ